MPAGEGCSQAEQDGCFVQVPADGAGPCGHLAAGPAALDLLGVPAADPDPVPAQCPVAGGYPAARRGGLGRPSGFDVGGDQPGGGLRVGRDDGAVPGVDTTERWLSLRPLAESR